MSEKIDEIKAELEQKSRQLQACKRRILAIMTKNTHGILIVDMGKTVRFANPAAAAIFGCKVEELTGKQFGYPLEPDKTAELQIEARDGKTVIVEMWAMETEWDAYQAYFVSLYDITERKRVEEKFRGVLESAPDAIVIVDSKGEICIINSQTEILFGYERRELYGQTVEMLIPERFRSKHVTQRADYYLHLRVLQLGTIPNLYGLRKDGHEFPVDIGLSPLDTDEGVLVIASIRDITERVRVEEALSESEERFRATFNQAAVGIGHVTPDGHWLRVNQKYCDITGYTEEELKALSVGDITHPDDLETTMKHFRRLLAGKLDNYSLEKRYVRKDGSIVWINLTASMVADAGGKPKFAMGVVEDITLRKRAEEELRLSEARFRALFRDNPVMIITLDADLTMLSVNPACASQLGYTVEELEGKSVLKLFFEDDRTAVAEQLRRCLQNPDQPYRWQFRKNRKDGQLLWVEETAQAVYDVNGTPNLLVVCQDVTERKRADEEIVRLNADLMVRAAELEAANNELEAFNYAVSHDLRRPLTNINGYCQVLNELCSGDLDERCKGYIKQIYSGTLAMNQLIDTLLNFSLLTRVELRLEMVNLGSIAKEIAEELSLTAPERRGTFRIATGITGNGDANLLRVVLENLLGNAWKFTSKQEEAVIEFGATEIDGKPAYFVRDNGAGFAMADAIKLFIPFQRLSSADDFKGHGIGLATVERIIHRHDGKVWAEGEPGTGATFYFTLNRARTI